MAVVDGKIELVTRDDQHVAFIEPMVPFESVKTHHVVVWGNRVFTYARRRAFDKTVFKEAEMIVVKEVGS